MNQDIFQNVSKLLENLNPQTLDQAAQAFMNLTKGEPDKENVEKLLSGLNQTLDEIKNLKQVTSHEPMIFGCRAPKSEGEGLWDGAFVWAQPASGDAVGAIFDKNKDYVANGMGHDEAVEEYKKFIVKGWKPMTLEDIEQTTNIKDIPLKLPEVDMKEDPSPTTSKKENCPLSKLEIQQEIHKNYLIQLTASVCPREDLENKSVKELVSMVIAGLEKTLEKLKSLSKEEDSVILQKICSLSL